MDAEDEEDEEAAVVEVVDEVEDEHPASPTSADAPMTAAALVRNSRRLRSSELSFMFLLHSGSAR